MSVWDVKSDERRDRWTFVPLVSVGPLRFGASHDEVVTALTHALAGPTEDIGVTTYYSNARLYCVAIDALSGPQVTLDGEPLVGRVPSEVERWMSEQASRCGRELRYTHAADPELADLGLLVRAQRAGDVVLTRPVFLDQRAEVSWDYVPATEWNAS